MIEGTLNVVLGLATSFVAWYVLWHLLSPKIELAPFITKREDWRQPERQVYRIKLRNMRRRPCFETSFDARIRHRSLNPDSNSFDFIKLPLSAISIFSLETNRVLRIYTTDLDSDSREYLERFGLDGLDLEQLLLQLPESRLTVSCITTDGFSGSRKCFWRHYTSQDVRQGKYRKKNPYGTLQTWYRTSVQRQPYPTLVIDESASSNSKEEPTRRLHA
jgi:hypothetical protein